MNVPGFRLLLIISLCNTFVACGTENKHLVTHHFQMGQQAFTIKTGHTAPTEYKPGQSIKFGRDASRPGKYAVRRSHFFTLRLAHARPNSRGYNNRYRLQNGATLYYNTKVEAGGSGGDHGTLSGSVFIKGVTLYVYCTTQDERGPNTEWCLKDVYSLQ